ncbi:MAG: hypothetical protein M3Q79_02195 [bacterium]|nr:hypothetical protein [bacterium]
MTTASRGNKHRNFMGEVEVSQRKGNRRGLTDRLTDFKRSHGTSHRLTAADNVAAFGGALANLMAAEAYLATAAELVVDDSAQADAFGLSIEAARKAENLATPRSYTALKTAKFLLDLPIQATLFTTGKLPSCGTMERYYQSGVNMGYDMGTALNEKWKSDDDDKFQLHGALGEIAVQLLLNRDSIYRIGDGSSLALPSTLLQDRGQSTNGIVSKSWDLSVFTDMDRGGSPELTYKVQVKTGGNSGNSIQYHDDIALVNIRDGLTIGRGGSSLPDPRPVSPQRIVQELAWEANGEARNGIIGLINYRTDMLLDIIDPVAA